MSEDRIGDAMSRIEKALARIETQAALSRSMPRGADADPDLARRHEALRASVTASLGELDALIAEMEA